MKKLYYVLLVLLCAFQGVAQIASYTVSESTGTYTPITGGTVLGTATANGFTPLSLDDLVYNLPSGTIPFNFNYNGVPYTGMNVSTNGFVTFGATAPAVDNYAPLSNSGTYDGAISAFGTDSNSLFNIDGHTGELRYQAVGSTPNQEFVIQYKNFRPYGTTSASPYWRVNFQIRLHENGSIRFVYDASFAGSAPNSTLQVGLRGANNTFATNVKNRLITNGTHTWAATAAGTSNTSTCALRTGNFPPSGKTIVFTPPVVASPPGCATGHSPAAAALGVAINPTLSWTAPAGATSYDIYLGTSPSPGILASNVAATSYAVTTPLSANTVYYWQVVPKNTAGPATGCSVLSFTTGTELSYCSVTYANGCASGTSLEGDAVKNVTLGTLTNASSCTAGSYTYYNALTVPNLQQGSAISVLVTMGPDGTQAAGAWIDFNRNGSFETGEGVVSALLGANSTATLNFTVPVGASLGSSRLRVRGGHDTVLTTADACAGTTWGETEDYRVNIIAPITDTPDYVNLQFPGSTSILAGGSATVYAQVYEAGVTEAAGAGAGIEAWIGISPIGSNSNPNTWTTWVPATFNVQASNNDEYMATIGSTLTPGTYYYASRFRLNGGPFVYGGFPFNQWNGTDSNSGVLTVNPNPTQCANLAAPADAATNVTIGTVALSWTAPSSGPAPTSYDVYFGTNPASLALLGNTATLTFNATAPAYSTVYYWRIIPKSAVGGDATGCATWSFTTQPSPFAPYCSTVAYIEDVEPITLVNFAGINNTSSNTVNGTPAIENFIPVTGAVTTESTYVLTLKGNTAGNFTNNFRVWFDWNHDGVFDTSERFNAGSVTNTNGTNATQAVTNITIPASALAGVTRMRVKKLYSADTGSVDDPCTGGQYGQTEDYSLNVTVCTQQTWYADSDNDGFGNPAVSQSACNQPLGFILNGTDCNDTDDDVWQSATFYVDADSDGYTTGVTATVCYGNGMPSGYVASLTAIDCNDTLSAVNPGATEVAFNGIDDDCDGTIDEGSQIYSQVLPSQCGTTLASISSLIGAVSYGAPVDGYRFKVVNLATSAEQVIDRNVPNFQLTSLATYDYAATYSISVQLRRNGQWLNYYGTACSVSTPAVLDPGGAATVNPSQCNIVLPSISTLIATTSLAGVTGYRFRITDTSNNAQQTIDRSLHWFSLTMLESYLYGRTYSIEVSVKTNGVFSGYGQPCMVTSPPVPTLTNCGVTIPTRATIVSTASLNRATSYRFQLTDMNTFQTITIDRSTNYFTFNNVPGFVYGAQYAVSVAVMTAGAWSDFGEACLITAPGAARNDIKGEEIAPVAALRAVVYPNPYTESFALDMDTATDEKIGVKVYDMVGRLVEEREFATDAIEMQQFGERYPSGVYNLIVSQGSFTKTLRVIKR